MYGEEMALLPCYSLVRFSCLVFFPVLMNFLTHLHTLLDNF
jgi:hypothetical protein